MTTFEERKQVIDLLNETTTAGARQTKACEVLGLSERTLQRWQTDGTVRCDQRPLRDFQPPHKLTAIERAEVMAVANSDEFGHLPPSQIVPRLADQGRYLASESTFYRLLCWFPSSSLGTQSWKLQLPVPRSWSFASRIPKLELGN